MKQHRSQRIHVAGTVHCAPWSAGLLRGQVTRRPHHLPAQRQAAVRPQAFGQPEVRHVRKVGGVNQHVRRFQVPVQDAAFVRVVDGLGNRLHPARAPFEVRNLKSEIGHEPGQARAIHMVHHQVRLTRELPDFVDGDDVRMLQATGGRCLQTKPFDRLGAGQRSGEQEFHRHNTVETDLMRPVNHPHGAPADFLEELVIPEALADRRCGGESVGHARAARRDVPLILRSFARSLLRFQAGREEAPRAQVTFAQRTHRRAAARTVSLRCGHREEIVN